MALKDYRRSYARRTLEDRLQGGERRVPGRIVIATVLGNTRAWVGFLLFGTFMIFAWVAICLSDFPSLFLFAAGVATTKGRVEKVERTQIEENRDVVHAVHYRFTPLDDVTRKGVSHTPRGTPDVESEVVVEYLAARPDISRIRGMRRNLLTGWLGLLLILPVIGAKLVLRGIRRGLGIVRLLRIGKTGKARVVGKEPTGTVINNQRVYEFTLQFAGDDGQTHQFKTRTHRGHLLEDDAEESIIYDPATPDEAVAVDTLAGGARLNERGEIEVGTPGALLRAILLPLLVVIVHGGFALYWFALRTPS